MIVDAVDNNLNIYNYLITISKTISKTSQYMPKVQMREEK